MMSKKELERIDKLLETGKGITKGWKPCPECGKRIYYESHFDLSAWTKKERKILFGGLTSWFKAINEYTAEMKKK